MDASTEITVKTILTVLGLGAVGWRHLRPGSLKPRQAGALLVVAAMVSILAYTNFGRFHGASLIHHWEQFHYFLGSKYFAELGYDGIYAASLAAEREITGRPARQSHVRDLRDNEVKSTAGVSDHVREVRARFEPERWQAFSADVEYFLTHSRYEYLTRVRRDHGYNPTPTWTFSASLFSRWIGASDRSLNLLALIDPLLLALMFAAVYRAYGARVACLGLIVFGLGYPWRFDWVGGAFLRWDWLAAVGISLAAMKSGRFGVAGGLVAYAFMVRVFPGGFLVGPTVVAVAAMIRERRIPPWFLRLAGGFAVGVLLCLAAGTLAGRGPASWTEFAANLEKHHGTWLTNNVGLDNVLLYDLDTVRRVDVNWSLPEPWLHWQAKMDRLSEQRRWVLLAATVLMLGVVVAASWHLEPHDAAVLGAAVAFAAVLLTCYYWAMLCLLPLFRDRWGPVAGWMVINLGLFVLHRFTPSFEMIYGVMSWALLAYFLIWLGPEAYRTLRQRSQPS